jgi:hypothetical protein
MIIIIDLVKRYKGEIGNTQKQQTTGRHSGAYTVNQFPSHSPVGV